MGTNNLTHNKICRALFVFTCGVLAGFFNKNVHGKSYQTYVYREPNFNFNGCQLGHTPFDGLIKLNYSQEYLSKNNYMIGWSTQASKTLHQGLKPIVGAQVEVIRCLPPGRWFYLGKAHVLAITGNQVQALLDSPSSWSAQAQNPQTQDQINAGNTYFRPMSGDIVVPIKTEVELSKQITPKYNVSWNQLLEKDEQGNLKFKLSSHGAKIISDIVLSFQGKTGNILIESYKLTQGSRDELRTSSMMMSQTIASYIKSKFEIPEHRIITLGYGSDWIQNNNPTFQSDFIELPEQGTTIRLIPVGNQYAAN